MTRALMFQGTGSDVGKTVLVAGLCRALKNRGLTVRPFKPQNMSNNAAVADDGGEIGRAQWLQALACNVAPSIHMNPVLLKPQSETGSQVVVHGRVTGSAKGRDYQALKARLLDAVLHSFETVKADADIVLIEGAGSPAEINLRRGDIANMGFATAADVPVVLVGDIDRGGVIASLVGTHTVLPPVDRQMIAGYLINKFRGDVSLFDDGLDAVTRFTDWPSFGVLPWQASAARLPAEDSVVLERLSRGERTHGLKIVVPVLDRIANFDDLDPLGAEPDVQLIYIRPGDAWPENPAAVILPGSKSTIADLTRFRQLGWDDALAKAHHDGAVIVGLCGGYQMLGQAVADPHGIEGQATGASGLGMLDVTTTMQPEKTVRNTQAISVDGGHRLSGYEIHLGETSGADCDRPVADLDGRLDGATSPDGHVFGTYLHGLFDSGPYRKAFLARLGARSDGLDHRATIEAALDELAAAIETHLNVDAMLSVATRHGRQLGAA
ncbi:MAG: cobyric acid synthase [Pseudomonadota bacterium]